MSDWSNNEKYEWTKKNSEIPKENDQTNKKINVWKKRHNLVQTIKVIQKTNPLKMHYDY